MLGWIWEFFSWTVFDYAQVKILSKKEQKLKAKPWIAKGIIISINFKKFIFKFSIKKKNKIKTVSFKNYGKMLSRVK